MDSITAYIPAFIFFGLWIVVGYITVEYLYGPLRDKVFRKVGINTEKMGCLEVIFVYPLFLLIFPLILKLIGVWPFP